MARSITASSSRAGGSSPAWTTLFRCLTASSICFMSCGGGVIGPPSTSFALGGNVGRVSRRIPPTGRLSQFVPGNRVTTNPFRPTSTAATPITNALRGFVPIWPRTEYGTARLTGKYRCAVASPVRLGNVRSNDTLAIATR